MVTCAVCGGEDFEKHAGFMYCAVCQTQSQDYHEQEYDYHDHSVNVVRHQKSHVGPVKTKKPIFYDDGLWTTWEGFNYILYGMTKEMKKFGVCEGFEKIVFKLWAAYLKECQVAFISRHEEKVPKLGFSFKERDARILYNIDPSAYSVRGKKLRSKSCSSKISNTSVSSKSSQSKRSLAVQRGRIMATEYQDHLSLSMQSSLADETLESLGKSSELEMTEQCSDGSDTLAEGFKLMFTQKDYKLYKNSYQSKKLMMSAKDKAKKDVHSPGKNKLLSIIHLALLMSGSQIQLSDLLRFIRESHLSYAKVTHFFPRGMKFPKKDFSYVEVTSDTLMPTHLRQRKITSQLARLLKIENISTPNINKLVDRYCQDLNLPQQLAEISVKISAGCVPRTTVPRSKTLLPSYEAWAVASIIFVFKLVLGLNDDTEIFLSRLAREINSATNNEHCLFVFEDWQKFIECRKTVLMNFHYPTQEQLGGNFFQNSKKFIGVLMKESKDEYRDDRFIPYSKYFIEEELLKGVKQTLGALSEPQNVAFFEFQPSLIPQVSHLETIMRYLTQETRAVEEETIRHRTSKTLPMEILSQSFKNCDLRFFFDPKSRLELMGKTPELCTKFSRDNGFYLGNREFLFDCSSKYWVFEYPDSASGHLSNFKEEILERTPENFQWLITECARMLEMNVRDIYDELLRLEKKLKPVTEDPFGGHPQFAKEAL